MTPNQGDNPNERRERQPGRAYQQPPSQPPQQPPAGQFQGGPPQGGQPPQQRPGPQGQGAMPPGGQPAQPSRMPGGGQTGQPGSMPPGQQTGGMGQQAPPQSGGQPGGTVPQQTQQQMSPGVGGQAMGGAQVQPTPQLKPVTVEEIVETDVVTAERDTPIATVVAEMAEMDVGSVVVVEDDEPVGVITDRKIALALENTPDVANKQAEELVSGDLVTGTTDMTVFDALDRLSDEGIRRLPIVDDDGTLEGIVTLDDLLVLLGSELNKIKELIQQQSPRL